MKQKAKKGLKRCPACNCDDNIVWGGYHYVSLICDNCGYEMWPLNEYESEDEFYEEWDNLHNLDKMIEDCETELKRANKNEEDTKEIKYRLLHYRTEKEKIEKIRNERKSQNY